MSSEDQETTDLKAQIEWGRQQLEAWPEKHLEFTTQMPEACLCSTCYLDVVYHESDTPQPDHYVLVLCPRGNGFLTMYRQADKLEHAPGGPREADGKLHPDTKYAIDSSALLQTVTALIESILRKGKAAGNQNGSTS